MKKAAFFLLTLFANVIALEVQPWFGDVYEFNLVTGDAFSWFNHVEGAEPPLKSTFYNNLLFADLEFAFSPEWSVDFDAEVSKSSGQPFGMRSLGGQIRRLFYDDVIGDFATLVGGVSFRYAFPNSLHDISSPYAAKYNLELNTSIGKEFDNSSDWRFRIWGFGAVGIAEHSSPWIRGIAAFEFNCKDKHKCGLFLSAIKGYGDQLVVNLDDFNGYGSIRHSAVDLLLRYGYRIEPWGTLRFEIGRRLYAELCPEQVTTVVVSFLFPFSF